MNKSRSKSRSRSRSRSANSHRKVFNILRIDNENININRRNRGISRSESRKRSKERINSLTQSVYKFGANIEGLDPIENDFCTGIKEVILDASLAKRVYNTYDVFVYGFNSSFKDYIFNFKNKSCKIVLDFDKTTLDNRFVNDFFAIKSVRIQKKITEYLFDDMEVNYILLRSPHIQLYFYKIKEFDKFLILLSNSSKLRKTLFPDNKERHISIESFFNLYLQPIFIEKYLTFDLNKYLNDPEDDKVTEKSINDYYHKYCQLFIICLVYGTTPHCNMIKKNGRHLPDKPYLDIRKDLALLTDIIKEKNGNVNKLKQITECFLLLSSLIRFEEFYYKAMEQL